MNFTNLPENLPRPVDDGAAAHLAGMRLPQIALPATSGESLPLAAFRGWVVVYVYPMTGRPGKPLPDGWDAIPGARGCTPQSCGFRDRHTELQALSASVYGLSAQNSAYQREAKARLHLPFDLLSDAELLLKKELRLPTFEVEGLSLYKRLTLITRDSRIQEVFYPVFPPDADAQQVLAWLQANA